MFSFPSPIWIMSLRRACARYLGFRASAIEPLTPSSVAVRRVRQLATIAALMVVVVRESAAQTAPRLVPANKSVTSAPSTQRTDTIFAYNDNSSTQFSVDAPACTGNLSGCSATPTPGKLTTVAQNGFLRVIVTYTAGSIGTGQLTINVNDSNTGLSSTGTINETVPPPAATVTPPVAGQTVPPGPPGFGTTFSIKNTGSYTTTYTLATACPSLPTCSNGGVTQTSALAPGATYALNVTYQAPAVGTSGTLNVTASAAGMTPVTGTLTVYGGATSVVSRRGTANVPSGATVTDTFDVKNLAPAGAGSGIGYSMSAACTGSITCVTAPIVTPSTFNLTGGQVQAVQLTYTANGTGNGTGPGVATLTASAPYGLSGSGNLNVNAGPIIVVARAPGLNGSVARNACLDMPLGKGASYECGDLRIAYSLPAITTMNKARAPTLLFVNSHANATTEITVDVALDGPTPTQIVPTLTIAGKAPVTLPAITWDPSTPTGTFRRITVPVDGLAMGLSTGAYHFTVQVAATVAGVNSAATSSGIVTVVNRNNSPFGIGWWLEGYEQLVQGPDAGTLMWVGGDGSTRIFTPIAANNDTFTVVSPLDRPDTLIRTGTGTTQTYQRHLPNGAYTQFDQGLSHIATVNSQGHRTAFVNAQGLLTEIDLPMPSGMIGPKYTFTYRPISTGSSVLQVSEIHMAGIGGADEPVFLNFGSTRWLDGIQFLSPGTTGYAGTWFTLNPTVASMPSAQNRQISQIWDPLGYAMAITYDQGKLTRTATTYASNKFIYNAFSPAELLGRRSGRQQAELLTNAVTWFDGPRTINDTTKFYVNQFGAPDTVVNALNQRTRFIRDVRFPLLAAQVIRPNGFTTKTTINARGLPDDVTDVQPFAPDTLVDAVTKYTWHSKWNLPLTVAAQTSTGPTSHVVTFGYDSNQPLRLSQFDGIYTTRYQYNGAGQVTLIQTPTSPTGQGIVIGYDTVGNLKTTTSRLGRVTTIYRDTHGRDSVTESPIKIADNKKQRTLTTYTKAGLIQSVTSWGPFGQTPAETLAVVNQYSLIGQLLQTTRRFYPDPAAVGQLTTKWEYDFAGRRVSEISPGSALEPSGKDSTLLDEAGNAIGFRPRRIAQLNGQNITMRYDELNRMTEKVVPSVRYVARLDGIPADSVTMTALQSNNNSYGPDITFFRHAFPLYPSPANQSDYVIPARADTFTYDPATGNMASAVNRDAVVLRTYYQNGALRSETQKLADSAGTDVSKHIFTIEYRYDLAGRRTDLIHSPQFRIGAPPIPWGLDRSRWSYDPINGELRSVKDVLSRWIDIDYDLEDRLYHVNRPGGISEQFTYDDDDNVKTDVITNGSSSSTRWSYNPLRSTTFWRDDRGKVDSLTDAGASVLSRQAAYSPLGTLLGTSYTAKNLTVAGTQGTYGYQENFAVDGLGNVNASSAAEYVNGGWFGNTTTAPGANNVYGSGTSRLRAVLHTPGGQRDTLTYDLSGNLEWKFQQPGNGNDVTRENAAYFYDGEGKLRASDTRSDDHTGKHRYSSHFDEYRYDALGRRTWVRSRNWCQDQNGKNPLYCRLNQVRRTVWDGSQELYEIQMPDTTLGQVYFGDNDDQLPLRMDPSKDPITLDWIDPNPMFGRVAYTFGFQTDQPLSVVRFGYTDQKDPYSFPTTNPRGAPNDFAAFDFFPLWDEEGKVEAGTVSDGGAMQYNSIDSVNFQWPIHFTAYGQSLRLLRTVWHGTLLENKTDASGLLYRRNRMYDPATGRFTQEDPLGLAGGLNLYGYAGGDPVNFSDPFGLCPKSAGGDGQTDVYSDCPKGTSGYNAYQDQIGKGGVGNDIAGVYHSCVENTVCKWGGIAVATYTGARLAIGAYSWVMGGGAGAGAAAAGGAGTAAASKIPFPEFQDWGRTVVGWGQNAAGAARAMAEMTAEKAATLDPAKVQAAKEFYENAVANGKGGAAAPARVELMQRILDLQR